MVSATFAFSPHERVAIFCCAFSAETESDHKIHKISFMLVPGQRSSSMIEFVPVIVSTICPYDQIMSSGYTLHDQWSNACSHRTDLIKVVFPTPFFPMIPICISFVTTSFFGSVTSGS